MRENRSIEIPSNIIEHVISNTAIGATSPEQSLQAAPDGSPAVNYFVFTISDRDRPVVGTELSSQGPTGSAKI